MKLAVSEVFGPTVQGEGPSTGRPCCFLRLGGCNLSCSWCDTAYTWDWTGTSDMAKEQGGPFDPTRELRGLTVDEVVDELDRFDVPLLVVSGGEPLQQQAGLAAVLRRLEGRFQVEVETNGTVEPSVLLTDLGVRFNVSPKLAHNGDPERRRIVPDALDAFARLAAVDRAAFKFVAATRADVAEVDVLVERHRLPRGSVWVMPEGRDLEHVTASLRHIADAVVEQRFHLSPRLHVQAWGDERGK